MLFEIAKLAHQNRLKELEDWLKEHNNEIDSTYSDAPHWFDPGVLRVAGQTALWGLWGAMVYLVARMLPPRMRLIGASAAAVLGHEGRRATEQHIFVNNPAPAIYRHGWTLLHFAAEGNAIETALFLISMGANTEIQGSDGTFLQIAEYHGHHAFIDACQSSIQKSKTISMLEAANQEKDKEINTVKKSYFELLESVDELINEQESAASAADIGPSHPATKASEVFATLFKKAEGLFAYGLQGIITNDYVPNDCFYEALAKQTQVMLEHKSQNPVGSAEINAASDALKRPIVILRPGQGRPTTEDFFGQELFFKEGKEPIFIGKIKDSHYIALTPSASGLAKLLDDFRKDFQPVLVPKL